ncbi:MAG: hypothetical protein AABY88_01580 [Pseudomonadota bacterium]
MFDWRSDRPISVTSLTFYIKAYLCCVSPALLVGTLLSAAPASAKIIEYRADLNGQSRTISTGSSARANAFISVETAKKTLAIRLNVVGLSVDSLWDKLVKSTAWL